MFGISIDPSNPPFNLQSSRQSLSNTSDRLVHVGNPRTTHVQALRATSPESSCYCYVLTYFHKHLYIYICIYVVYMLSTLNQHLGY